MKIFLLLLFWSLWYVIFSTRTILSPVLPIIEDELAITHGVAGSIFSFLSVGYAMALVLSGRLAPRIGYKRSIILGLAILMTSLICLKYSTTYISIAAVSLFIGLGSGLYLPSAIPLLTAIFRRENWGKAIAIHDTAASLSNMSVPLIIAVALRVFHWRTPFVILSTACFIAAVTFWLFSPDPQPQEEKSVGFLHVLRRRSFWIIAVLWIFGASNGGGLYTLIPLFLVKENQMPLEMANTMFGVSRIGGLFVAILAGFLVDRFGVKKILFLVLFVTGLSTISLALAQTVPLLLASLFFQATFSIGFFPVALVAISKVTSFNERSIFTGATIAIGVVFGLGFTPVILGTVADFWNFQTGIFVLGVLTILSCVLLKGI